jgi:hypothetical protein
MAAESARLAALRDRLLAGLRAGIDRVTVNGSLEHRLPHNLHVSFAYVDHASLVLGIGDIAVSSGSACGSASAEPSHVLQAIGGNASDNSATIRFGIGRFTTEDEIDYTIEKFTTVVRKLRDTAPARRPAPPRLPMKITVAHSPDSDDAFMFYGLASGAVRTDGSRLTRFSRHRIAEPRRVRRPPRGDRGFAHAYAHLADRACSCRTARAWRQSTA